VAARLFSSTTFPTLDGAIQNLCSFNRATSTSKRIASPMGKVGHIAIHPLEGNPKGLRIVEHGNWAGRGLVAPMASWAALLARMELDLGGIFFLKRPASATRGGQIWLGMAPALRPALAAIAVDPILSDISEVLVIVRRWGWQEGEELTYLVNEFRIMRLAKPGWAMYGEVPSAARPKAEKRVELELDLDHVFELLKECGFEEESKTADPVDETGELDKPIDKPEETPIPPSLPKTKPVVRPRVRPASKAPKPTAQTPPQQPELFNAVEADKPEAPVADVPVIGKYHLEKRSINANMDIIDGRFVVRKGSQARKIAYPSMANNYRKMRERLVEQGILVEAGEEHYVFTQDYAFDSASTAASVANGAQTAGPRAWYDDDNVSLRGIKNDHHSLHETHRKPKGEIPVEEHDVDISASFKFFEEDDVLDEALGLPLPAPDKERASAPVLVGNERLTPSPVEESEHGDAVQTEVAPPSKVEAGSPPIGAYRIIGKQVRATMDVMPDGFMVRRGSQALQKVSGTIAKHYLELRAEMVAAGVLVERGEAYFEFTQDYLFSSISAASSIVLGRQTDGWISWRDQHGRLFTQGG
jgi:Domain of unknown function (DUF4357)